MISRSSTMEKSHKSSRGSASPNRLSPSPRSGSSTFQSRGRPSSAPHSSPTHSLRHASPSRRPSPPPSKPSTPLPRSSTPTAHWATRGPESKVSLSGIRSASPVKSSRGNSASPKMRAWQTNIPGFSPDAPPNLQTSPSDRPPSYARGSSPASRNGRDLFSKSGRQSMSPTASRSVSSSHSHDRDPFSTHSKGSIASSGDDDVDSLQSMPMGSSDCLGSKGVIAFPSDRSPKLSKKPSRKVLSSSASKRSFDSALRQMDHRKGPQNMFRPLLSSVPSSTFYAGKASASHHAMISRNSSVTTSSNASSDQGTIGLHETEGCSEQNEDDISSECGKVPYPDVQEDLFTFDEGDALKEDIIEGVHTGSPNAQHGDFSARSEISGSHHLNHLKTCVAATATSEKLEFEGTCSEFDSVDDILLCSKCGSKYSATDLTEGNLKLCGDCRRRDESLAGITGVPTVVALENSSTPSMKILDKSKSTGELEFLEAVPESSEVTVAEVGRVQHEESVKVEQASTLESNLNLALENSVARPPEEDEQMVENELRIGQPTAGYDPTCSDTGVQKMQDLGHTLSSMVHVSEGSGISILLQRSSSSKGPVFQGRTFAAIGISYDDPSYMRDSSISMRSSHAQGSASASSSVDLGSSRQTEARVQRQSSGKKSDIANYRHDISMKHQRTGSSMSGTSTYTLPSLAISSGTCGENFEVAVAHLKNEVVDVTYVAPLGELLVENRGHDTYTEVGCNNLYGTQVVSTSEPSTHTLDIHLCDGTVASLSNAADSASYGNGEESQKDVRSTSDQEVPAMTPEGHTLEEDNRLNSSLDGVDATGLQLQSSLDNVLAIEVENGRLGCSGSDSEVGSPNSKNSIDDIPESLVLSPDKDTTALVAEPQILDQTCSILEESTVLLDGHDRTKSRSLTLEQATEAILFCSSIVHNLAYEAATIAIDNENPAALEDSLPMPPLIRNFNRDRKDPRGQAVGKCTPRSQKPRQKLAETESKTLPSNTDNDENVNACAMRIVGVPNKADSMKPAKLESKCNCAIM